MTGSYLDILIWEKQKLLLLWRPLLRLIYHPQILTLVGNSVQILLKPPETPHRHLQIQISSLASASAFPPESLMLPTTTTTLVSDLGASRAPQLRDSRTTAK